MADENIGRALSTLVWAFAILSIIETTSSQESCPYPPCANDPPPASAGNPTSPSAAATDTPAQPGATYPPPAGYFPHSPPPPSGGFDAAPPPPDPILPYFPYYYWKPPRTRTEESSATGVWRWTVVIIGVVAGWVHLWFYLM